MLKSGKSLRRAIEAGIEILRAEDGEVSVANLGTLMSERFSEVMAAHGDLLQQAGFRAYCRGVIKHARRKEGLSADVIQSAFHFAGELPEFVAVREKRGAAFPWLHLSDCTVAHLDQNLSILDKQAIDDERHRDEMRRFRDAHYEMSVRFGKPDITVGEATRLLS